jgi:hypothetical protein
MNFRDYSGMCHNEGPRRIALSGAATSLTSIAFPNIDHQPEELKIEKLEDLLSTLAYEGEIPPIHMCIDE